MRVVGCVMIVLHTEVTGITGGRVVLSCQGQYWTIKVMVSDMLTYMAVEKVSSTISFAVPTFWNYM